jgi:hypothetical protein
LSVSGTGAIERTFLERRLAQKLEKLKDKRVKATGKLTYNHGVETGDRGVLEVSSIKESKAK